MTLEHGGDLFAAQQVYSGEILDFSVNINPLGPAPQALEAARAALERAGEYPDPLCRALRQAIAARDGVQPEQVLCGNGAAEVIFRLALALRPRRAADGPDLCRVRRRPAPGGLRLPVPPAAGGCAV